jgi:murein DD-endopeptidase MepM/ murein hydrolase activator NlpD
MQSLLMQIKGRFPTVHLAAASICGAILGITLLLLPSEEVSATRSAFDASTLQHESTDITLNRIRNTLELPLNQSSDSTLNDSAEKESRSNLDTANLPSSLGNNKAQETSAQSQQAVPAEAPPENWISYTVQKNDNLTSLFKRAGLSATDVYNISNATKTGNELSRLYPGEKLSFNIEGGELKKVKYKMTPLKTLYIESGAEGYKTRIDERTPVTKQRYAEGVINNSLFVDANNAGVSNNLIMRFAGLFGWDIDFSQDIQPGDTFKIIYNEQFIDGKKISDGNIIAAQFTNQGETFTAIRYTDSENNTSYYTPDGHSMRKAFLRMPVDFARISSGFTTARKHPVLNKIRAHKGVDYAASTGTPIKASGDGKVIWLGTKNGFGRTIILQHGNSITTLYAHMSKYNSKLKQGSKVKQGQVIGYIGQSGLATGPHLHYEFQVNGAHKNPMTVKFPQAEPVPPKERLAFATTAKQIVAMLDSRGTTQYARAN